MQDIELARVSQEVTARFYNLFKTTRAGERSLGVTRLDAATKLEQLYFKSLEVPHQLRTVMVNVQHRAGPLVSRAERLAVIVKAIALSVADENRNFRVRQDFCRDTAEHHRRDPGTPV